MKVKKAIKKIAAMGMGATMLGATILGASAADLGDYPNMFMKNGQFNGYLVVGENSLAIDTIGMTNIALGLQAKAVTKTEICGVGSTPTVTVDDGIKIERSSADFVLGADIEDIQSTLDESDMPDVLADGTYTENEGESKNDEQYTQVFNFVNGSGVFVYDQDKKDAPKAGPYLSFPRGKTAYEYVLEFDSPVDFAIDTKAHAQDDFESTTINIQGQTYTITDVDVSGSTANTYNISKLTMLVGDTMMWMTQDDVVVKTIDGVDHTIEMVDVSIDQTKCGFKVDGSTIWIDVDSTDTIFGVTIGVTDAVAVNTEAGDADICEVNFGAQEMILEEGQEVDRDGNDVDGSSVTFTLSSLTPGEWEGIKITWAPDDDIYLAPGDKLVDPVFGNFEFIFGGIEAEYDNLVLAASGEDLDFTFKNSDGEEVVIPFYAMDSGVAGSDLDEVGVGEDSDVDEQYYYDQKSVCTGPSDVTDCEGARWIVEVGGEAHIVEVTDISISDMQVDFDDVTYDISDNDNDISDIAGGDNTVYISGLGDISIRINNSAHTVELANIGHVSNIETAEEATIAISEPDHTDGTAQVTNISITEEAVDDASLHTDTITIDLSVNSDEEIEIGSPASAVGFEANALDYDDTNDDDKIYVTEKGTVIEWDSDDKFDMTIKHAVDDVKAEVFVAPTGASVVGGTSSSGDCQITEKQNPIPSTVNKFDSEISNPHLFNLITIGGPCANKVTSELMGNPEVCNEGFVEGKALLKLVETGDKVALIVAGGMGSDTLAAAKVLQNSDSYASKLKGKELMLTTVSESNIGFEYVE